MIPTIFFSSVFAIAGYKTLQAKKQRKAAAEAKAAAELEERLEERLLADLKLHLKEELNKARPAPQKRRKAKAKPVEAKEPDWALLDKPAYMRRSGKK